MTRNPDGQRERREAFAGHAGAGNREEIDRDAVGELEFLVRSPYRLEVLEELRERPLTRDDLRARCDASRTTLQRNLTALADQGWIRSADHRFELTRAGWVVVDRLLDLVEIVTVAERLQPFLRQLDPESFDLELTALVDAELAVSADHNPYSPVNRHVNAMQSADRFRCLVPSVALQPLMIARECVIERGQSHEAVLDPAAAELVRADETYRSMVEELCEADPETVFVADESVPFYLGIFDDIVQIGVENDNGMPHALVESSGDDVVAWGEQTYDHYRRNAERFDVYV